MRVEVVLGGTDVLVAVRVRVAVIASVGTRVPVPVGVMVRVGVTNGIKVRVAVGVPEVVRVAVCVADGVSLESWLVAVGVIDRIDGVEVAVAGMVAVKENNRNMFAAFVPKVTCVPEIPGPDRFDDAVRVDAAMADSSASSGDCRRTCAQSRRHQWNGNGAPRVRAT